LGVRLNFEEVRTHPDPFSGCAYVGIYSASDGYINGQSVRAPSKNAFSSSINWSRLQIVERTVQLANTLFANWTVHIGGLLVSFYSNN